MSLATATVLAVGLVALASLYVFGFIFIHGSAPGKNANQDSFIHETCAPTGLWKTVFTWGYTKASFRRFIQYYKLVLFPQPVAKQGCLAPDAVLITLAGTECSLLQDYVSKMPSGMPLILNMGSFT